MILPLCTIFVRRPVLLGCCLLLLGSTIGAAKSNSYLTHDEEAREYGAFDGNILTSNNGRSTHKRSLVLTLNPVSPVLPNDFKVAGTDLIQMLPAWVGRES